MRRTVDLLAGAGGVQARQSWLKLATVGLSFSMKPAFAGEHKPPGVPTWKMRIRWMMAW